MSFLAWYPIPIPGVGAVESERIQVKQILAATEVLMEDMASLNLPKLYAEQLQAGSTLGCRENTGRKPGGNGFICFL